MKVNNIDYYLVAGKQLPANHQNMAISSEPTNILVDRVEISDILKYRIPVVGGNSIEFIYSRPNAKTSAKVILADEQYIDIKDENLPKELRAICRPEQFSAFLKDSYAKVAVLSDGNYKLYVNHRLLGGGKEYLENIINTTNDRLSYTISSEQAFSNLGINYKKYDYVDDAILVTAIAMSQGFILEQLNIGRTNIDDVNSAYLEDTINRVINLKFDQFYKELLPYAESGLDILLNKILNKEDDNTISVVKYFFNYIEKTKISDTKVKENLKNERFISYIYVNLLSKLAESVKEKFIIEFKKYEVQATPIKNERVFYEMPESGICHGACLVSSTLEEDYFYNREQILKESSLLQQRYHQVRNPNPQEIFNELIAKITKAVGSLDNEDKPPPNLIKPLIEKNNKEFQDFLKQNNIDISALFIASRITIQNNALQNFPELQIFANAEMILDEIKLVPGLFNTILSFLDNKILDSKVQTKHIILITFEEKADISKAMKKLKGEDRVPQAHDILIRVDTDVKGNIQRLIFSDLQDTGVYIIIQATDNSKVIQEALPESLNLVSFYSQNYALKMFDKISAKYISKS